MSNPATIPLPLPLVVNHSIIRRTGPPQTMTHAEHTIGLVVRGQGHYQFGPWSGEIGEPSLGILPAGEVDGNALVDGFESWYCCVHWPGIDFVSLGPNDLQARLPGGDLGLRRNLSVDAPTAARVARQFHDLKQQLEHPGGSQQLRAASLLLNLLLDYSDERRTATSRQGHRSLSRFHDLLREHACSAMTLRDMSARAGLSTDHMRDLFVREFGRTPQQYRLEIRLSRGRDLLAGGHTVREAADACGFADPSYFSRAFRKQFGIRPTDLIRRCKIH
jgi:AraC-like DNA-binding protein